MLELTAALLGALLLGLAMGWLFAAARLRTRLDTNLLEAEKARARAEEKAVQERRLVEEERRLLHEAEEKLKDTFTALSAEALKSNNDQFLKLARERLESLHKEGIDDLEKRQKAIQQIVEPVAKSLEKMDEEVRKIEKARSQAYGTLTEQVKSLIATQATLRAETANLVKALRAPSVRGRWGEMQLKRVVELAGMLERCDFYPQETTETDTGRLRPDMRVQLPGGRSIVVDAKTPLAAYLDALEAPSEEIRIARLRDHARQVRDHMAKLSAKAYWDYLQPAPEFVVLFLPGEIFFSAALEQDPALIEQGVNQRVLLATPTTLIALLRAVAYGWRQEQLAENADKISELGRQLHQRLATMGGHFARLGGSLKSSVDAFNSTVGSLEGRVMPAARRFKELGVSSKQEIGEIAPVDSTPRTLAATAGSSAPSESEPEVD